MEQGRAEAPLRDRLLEVRVRRRDQAHVDFLRGRAAHPLHLAGLQDPQQHGLHLGRRLADLVEEQGAAVGALEEAGPVVQRAGVGAADGAEELGRGEAGGDGPDVDADAGRAVAPAGRVDGTRHELLARAGLAAHQHRHVEVGDAADLVAQPHDPFVFADQVGVGRGRAGDRRRLVQEKHDAIGELEDDAATDLRGGEIALGGNHDSFDRDAGPALAGLQPQGAGRRGFQTQRAAAQVGIAQRARLVTPRRREVG